MNLETYASDMVMCGPAFALVEGKTVWGCAGVRELESHRAESWALIHEEIGTTFFRFHKGVVEFLDNCKYKRVEMVTVDGFKKAERWAEMLGFKWEGCMQKYFPDGGMGNLYARIK